MGMFGCMGKNFLGLQVSFIDWKVANKKLYQNRLFHTTVITPKLPRIKFLIRAFPLYLQGGPQICPYFSLAITFTKIRTPPRFFLQRYWKFIEFFWWKQL